LGEEAKRRLAGALYDSVHEKIAHLPDGVEIYPAHGAGSLCGAGMADRPQSTLGYERFCNVFMADREKQGFIETVLKSVPEFPDYYRRMKRLNSEGPAILDGIPGAEPMTPLEVEEAQPQLKAVVIDLRRPEAFGGAHILVGEAGTKIEEARRSLVRAGLDDIRGYLKGGMQAWIERGCHRPMSHRSPCANSPADWSKTNCRSYSTCAVLRSGRRDTSRARYTSRAAACRSSSTKWPRISRCMSSAAAATGPALPPACLSERGVRT
jgi:hypothetical protein